MIEVEVGKLSYLAYMMEQWKWKSEVGDPIKWRTIIFVSSDKSWI